MLPTALRRTSRAVAPTLWRLPSPIAARPARFTRCPVQPRFQSTMSEIVFTKDAPAGKLHVLASVERALANPSSRSSWPLRECALTVDAANARRPTGPCLDERRSSLSNQLPNSPRPSRPPRSSTSPARSLSPPTAPSSRAPSARRRLRSARTLRPSLRLPAPISPRSSRPPSSSPTWTTSP
jgi:hypothetical protein